MTQSLVKNIGRCLVLSLAWTSLILLTACTSTPPPPPDFPGEETVPTAGEKLRVGDMLNVTFSGPNPAPPEHNERIPEDGYIRLPNIEKVKAVGRTRVEVQEEIQQKYVPQIYRFLTVTIAPAERFFYVYGEVNKKDRHPYLGELTILDAIAAAGGFTDFARKSKVQLIRVDGSIEVVDCVKALKDPKRNPKIHPGDRVYVPRRIF